MTLSWPRVRREDWFNFAKFWISKSMLDSGVRGVITYYVAYTVFSSRTSFLAQRGAERSIGKPEVESHY